MDRPAVVYAILFAVGIWFGRHGLTAFLLVLLCGVMLTLFLVYQRLRRAKRPSMVDRFLWIAVFFFAAGFFVMRQRTLSYEENQERLSFVSKEREMVVQGKVTHLSYGKEEVRFQLNDAKANAWYGEQEEFVPVGTMQVVYAYESTDTTELPKEGQRVLVYGSGGPAKAAENPGQFDAKAYYFSLSITGTMYARALRITDTGYNSITQAFAEWKRRLMTNYVTYFGEEGAGVLSSMLLGERSMLSEETEELYRAGGISHLLAISGLHVSLLGLSLFVLLRRTILGRNLAIVASIVVVIFYGTFVGASISTKRAVLMFFLMLLAKLLGRTYDSLSALSLCSIVILAGSPGALFTASFQLSFAAAYGASVLTKGFQWRGRVASVFAPNLAISLVTIPFTARHFYVLPFYGCLLNPIVLPLVMLLLLSGMLTGIFGLFCPLLGHFFAGAASAILYLYRGLCELVERLPFSTILVGQPRPWQLMVYFLLLCVFLSRRKRGKTRGVLQRMVTAIVACALLPLTLFAWSPAPLCASVLSIGQGDGIVLARRCGPTILVDGGNTAKKGAGTYYLQPFFRARRIRVIDCVFVSHYDSDHISGIMELLTAMPKRTAYRESAAGYDGTVMIRRMVLPQLSTEDEAAVELITLARSKGVELQMCALGDELVLGGEVRMQVLWPEVDRSYNNRNASSMVLLATYGEFDFLLTGDITEASEKRLCELYGHNALSVEVLKVPHHGSNTSSSKAFLRWLQPQAAVISCGQNNKYGHPHEAVVKRYETLPTRLLRTDIDGCVDIHIGRNGWRVKCFRKR